MPSSGSGPTRRGLLGLIAAAAGTGFVAPGCTSGSAHPAAVTSAPAADPDVIRNLDLLSSRVTLKFQLVQLYESTAKTYPTLAGALATPLAHHREHQQLLISQIQRISPVAAAKARSQGNHVPVTTPGAPTAVVLANLAARERAAAAAGRTACAHATGMAAGLLGSCGAAEAAHAELLTTPGTG